MSQSTSYLVRQEILSLRNQGASLNKIHAKTGVGKATVQRLCARIKQEGEAGIVPKYANCGLSKPDRSNWAYRSSLWLRRLHPRWGAPLIHLKLSQKYPSRKLPSIRTLQNWFKWSSAKRCRNSQVQESREWAKQPHDTWQGDAKEQGKLVDGKPYCWLTLTDEKSGGLIEAPLFPPQPYQSGE